MPEKVSDGRWCEQLTGFQNSDSIIASHTTTAHFYCLIEWGFHGQHLMSSSVHLSDYTTATIYALVMFTTVGLVC